MYVKIGLIKEINLINESNKLKNRTLNKDQDQ